jgi:hypothetical protein
MVAIPSFDSVLPLFAINGVIDGEEEKGGSHHLTSIFARSNVDNVSWGYLYRCTHRVIYIDGTAHIPLTITYDVKY